MTAPKSAPRKGKPTYIAGATAAENRASSKKSAAKANTRKSNTGSVSAALPKKKSSVIRNVSSGSGGTSKAPGYIAPMQATTAPAGGTSSSPSDSFTSIFESIRNQPSGGGMNGFTGFQGMDDVKKLFGL